VHRPFSPGIPRPGLYHPEGWEDLVKDGDVLIFEFNVCRAGRRWHNCVQEVAAMSQARTRRVARGLAILGVGFWLSASPGAQHQHDAGDVSVLTRTPLTFGALTARFAPEGDFEMEGSGWPTFRGSWRRAGDELALVTSGGPEGCDAIGRYRLTESEQEVRPVPTYEWGTASSPIIWNDLVILQCDTQADWFLLALDVRTGEVVWKTERDELPSWGTATVFQTPSGPELVTNAPNFIRGCDPRSGEERWRLGGSSMITAPTPVLADGLFVVASGRAPERPLFAVPRRAWRSHAAAGHVLGRGRRLELHRPRVVHADAALL
jgi:hypothetical protein